MVEAHDCTRTGIAPAAANVARRSKVGAQAAGLRMALCASRRTEIGTWLPRRLLKDGRAQNWALDQRGIAVVRNSIG
jgi:hypothetical protein